VREDKLMSIRLHLKKEGLEGTLRISLGRWTSKEDVDRFLEALPPIIERLRKNS